MNRDLYGIGDRRPRMVITRAPLRISFVGGGSDVPLGFARVPEVDQVGQTVSTAIDKHVYCIAKWRHDKRVIVNWRQREEVNDVSALQHDLIREVLLREGVRNGIEISTFSDVPGVGSGLGSSSATTVAAVLAVACLKGIQPTREDLAEAACDVELERIGHFGGRQDQYTTAFGGCLHLHHRAGSVSDCKSIHLTRSQCIRIAEHLPLFSPRDGFGRDADDILKDRTCQGSYWSECCDLASRLVDAIGAQDYTAMASLISAHHGLKCTEFRSYMDGRMQIALNATGHPYKLCGAGGTGHLLVGCTPETREAVTRDITPIWGPPLPWEPVPYGTEVIHAE